MDRQEILNQLMAFPYDRDEYWVMLYGIKGKDGKGYPNPEIIQGIIDYLK